MVSWQWVSLSVTVAVFLFLPLHPPIPGHSVQTAAGGKGMGSQFLPAATLYFHRAVMEGVDGINDNSREVEGTRADFINT